ncbi:glycosyltransferase [Robertmurraya korlensis]|uniref:glycosyltransferase n=1 Tax=Robertmurraya korlensis TaxID=519977 RepID=UPI00203FA675|nr:glycosyltransferase [Robertmurraya korlensis]MCM3602196.1 glycosyltransferase [Robertmurraya korlensis]
MKILHIQQYYNEKMGYQENILPYYQKKLGHEVVLITSTRSDGFNNDSRVKKEAEFEENGFIVKRKKIKGEFKRRFVIFDDLYKILDDEKPDYIFHHSVTSPSIKTVSRYKQNNPHVFIAVDNHADLNISGRNKLWKLFYYNLFWKYIISKHDKFIDIYFGVTPSRCLFLEEELGVRVDKIKLLPIGADVDNADVTITKEKLLEKYDIDKNCIIVTHGGKITPEKQIDRIILAFKRVNNPNIRLVLFGDIQDKKVETLIKTDSRIQFIGWLDRKDTLALLKHSDIGIWNTQHTTLLEDCVAVGLPLLLRYYGSTSHLIDRTGLFLYEGSIREIYEKLLILIENKHLLEKFKQNAFNLCNLLSYENIAFESIEYTKDLRAKETHKKFMSVEYSDDNYLNFRVINRM